MSKNWYILHTYTGYEGKIERTIKSLIEKFNAGDKTGIDPEVVIDVRVPVEELVEIKDGKKRTRSNKFLPGYIMLEMDLPEIGWKDTCAKLYKIQGVTGFVGNVSRQNRPIPITKDEAMNLLQKSGVIKGDKQVRVRQSFNVGVKASYRSLSNETPMSNGPAPLPKTGFNDLYLGYKPLNLPL